MLAIKNRGAWRRWIGAFICVLLAGCTPPGPRAVLEGKRLLDAGKYAEAAVELRTATNLLPTNALAWEYLGVACQHCGQVAEADRAYHRALTFDHDLSEAHYNLGCLWLEHDKIDTAKAEFTAFNLRRSNAPEGLLKLGATQLRAAQLENTVAARVRELNAAEKDFEEALRLSPQNPEGLNGMGLIRAQRGRSSEAAQFFIQALKQQPGYAPSELNLAIVEHQYLRDYPMALREYRQYLASSPPPANAEAVSAMVRQLEQQLAPPPRSSETNNTSPARTNQLSAPPNPRAPATTPPPKLEAQGNAPEPTVPRPLHASASPTPAATAADLPARYHYQNPARPAAGNHAKAAKAYAEGLRAQATNGLAEAAQAYRVASQWDPSFFEAAYNLALTESKLGNLRASLSAYERALAIRPDSPEARYNFALLLEQADYPLDAADEMEKLLSAYPTDARAQLVLANLYAQKLHQPAKAGLHYQKVLDLQPNHPQAEAIRQWLDANPAKG